MIKPITQFMRDNAAYCIQGPAGRVMNANVKYRLFFNKNNELIAKSTTFSASRGGNKVFKTILQTVEGLVKITEQKMNVIKFRKYNGKKNFKYPYSVSSSVIYNDSPEAKRKLFFIKSGVKFLNSDEEGYLVYKKQPIFRTQKLTLTSPVNKDDFIFDSSNI